MTGDLTLDLLISLAAVAVIVAVVAALGGWRRATVDAAAARDRLVFDEPDFVPETWLVGVDGRAALALSDREMALALAVGDGLTTRRAPRGAWPAARDGAAVVLQLGEPSIRRARLVAPDAQTAAAWLSRIAAPGYEAT